MAVRYPKRIRKLAVDGVPLFTSEFKKEALERYAPEVKPDAWGGHLAWAWNRAVEGSMYWPPYVRDEAHRMPSSNRTPEQVHKSVMDTLKALSTYHIAYRAAFRQDVHALLPQVTQPTLVMAIKRDPLHTYLDEAASMIRDSRRVMIDTEAGNGGKLAALQQFFET
jgi:pimeloyl-ACP methyl ester carboxylesterase